MAQGAPLLLGPSSQQNTSPTRQREMSCSELVVHFFLLVVRDSPVHLGGVDKQFLWGPRINQEEAEPSKHPWTYPSAQSGV